MGTVHAIQQAVIEGKPLTSRIITVTGEGVIGQQPFIKPEQSFTYSSGCVLKSPLGNMQGHYQMQTHSAALIQVEIPPFRLAKPNILN